MDSNEALRKKVQGTPENLLPPEIAPLKHGIWAFHRARILRCNQCQLHKLFGGCPEYKEGGECVHMEKRGIQLRDQLMGLPQMAAEDSEIIGEYIFITQVLELIQAVLPGLGVLVEKDSEVVLHPLLADKYLAWSKRRQALGAELGIGPMARKKLTGTGERPMGRLTAAIMNLDEKQQEGGDGNGRAET